MTKINKTLRNSIIFAFIFTIFLLIDLLTKHFWFNKTVGDFYIIGIRSQAHYSTTFLDFIKVSLDDWINILISMFVGSIITIMIIFAKSKVSVIGLSIMFAGTMGNTLDNIFEGYVRNVIYIPWFDRGTFNFADLFIVCGLPFALIPMLINSFKEK